MTLKDAKFQIGGSGGMDVGKISEKNCERACSRNKFLLRLAFRVGLSICRENLG